MASFMAITQRAFNGKTSTTTFQGDVINEVNFVAQTALQDAVSTAVDGVCLGVFARDARTSNVSGAQGLPASEDAQRGTKWLIGGYDSTADKKWSLELACADYALLDESDPNPLTRNSLDLTAGAGLALKSAVEGYHKPFGNTVEMQYCVAVSRNV